MSDFLLVAEAITKKYGDYTALNEVSLQIERGKVFGLLGPNGAGKTSFIRILNQIIYPDKGSIIFDKNPLSRYHIKDIGYLPEERGLYKNMKIEEQLLYLAQLKGLTKNDAKKNLDFWFNRLEIDHWRGKKVQELSKGMAQKVQFIATIIHKPKLLIFDELFSGLDPVNAELIKDQVLFLKQEGATIIFSTHRMESVEEMCDNIALINRSNKVLDGNVVDIKKQFKENIYQVGIISKEANLYEKLSEKFEVTKADFKSVYNEEKFYLHHIKENEKSEVLQFLVNNGEITHFSEVIPSINDIFIKMVTQ